MSANASHLNQMANQAANQVKPAELANSARRRFMTGVSGLAAGLGIPAALGVAGSASARPVDEPASSDVRWGMLIDTTKCSKGCTACVDACETENGLDNTLKGSLETKPQWIRKVELKHTVTGRSHSLPIPCQHCESAPCVDVCPTGASFQRADGIALVDRHTCIGCRYCMMACPYKARSFVHEDLTNQMEDVPRGKGCVESCTLCVHRIDSGNLTPACVEACTADNHNAMIFGDLNDPNSEVSKAIAAQAVTQIRSDLGTNPAVVYRGIPG